MSGGLLSRSRSCTTYGLLVLALSLVSGCPGEPSAGQDAASSSNIDAGNTCVGIQCSGHGQCALQGGSPVCSCDSAYTGSDCAACATGHHRVNDGSCVDDESCASSNPCGAHGSCDDTDGIITCACAAGYQGQYCTSCAAGHHTDGSGNCVLDQQCLATSCSYHGACAVAQGAVQCTCETGYSGSFCAQCESQYHRDATGACSADQFCPQVDPCSHGTCDDSSHMIVCLCATGYRGDTCSQCAAGFHDAGGGTCAFDQQCLGTSCSNHGTCNDTGGVVSCQCSTGFAGAHCERCDTAFHRTPAGDCAADQHCPATDPCLPAGTCVDSSGDVACACEQGYTGQLCEVCAANYHRAGSGQCVVDQTCSTPDPCAPHGRCDDALGVANCLCDVGYVGALCQDCYPGYAVNPVSGLCEVPCDMYGWQFIRCNGQCIDGLSRLNCGGCGRRCSGAEECGWDGQHASCRCPLGRSFDQCNGVCANLQIDEQHCGDCAVDCGSDKCFLGNCLGESAGCYDCGENAICCNPGFCLSADQGLWDNNNCGGCGIVCNRSAGEACVLGTCYAGDAPGQCRWCDSYSVCCAGGAAAQDGGVPDGNGFDSGPGSSYCHNAWSFSQDNANCGGCNIRCGANELCAGGQCTCPSLFGDPNYAVCGTGCIDLRFDDANCGACDHSCASGESCVYGECRRGDGTLDCGGTCSDAQLCCATAGWPPATCTDISRMGWDTDNCGGCNIVCSAHESCVSGDCICQWPNRYCGGVCTDLSQPDHCGSCTNACSGDEVCEYSYLGFACNCPTYSIGFTQCDGICTNILFNEGNCSRCGSDCSDSAARCMFGQCQLPDAPTGCGGNGDCGAAALCCQGSGSSSDGGRGDAGAGDAAATTSCVDQQVMSWSTAHCGGCNIQCRSDQICDYGRCVCRGDEEDCDGQCVSISFDENNCGTCGVPCAANERCINRSCRLEQPTCSFSWVDAGPMDATIPADADVPADAGAPIDAATARDATARDAPLGDGVAEGGSPHGSDGGSGGGYGFCESFIGQWALCCGDTCVDTAWDSRNCGGCGQDCGNGACYWGVCECWWPTQLCDGYCQFLNTDLNCGSCSNSCLASEYCAEIGYDYFRCEPLTDGGIPVDGGGVPDASAADRQVARDARVGMDVRRRDAR